MAKKDSHLQQTTPSRRQFLKTGAAAAGTAWWVSGKAYGLQESSSPMEQLNLACIGVDGKGDSDSSNASKVSKIVAICDIDARRLKKKAGQPGFTEAKQFADSREMLESMGDKIDGITVSTPDHTHAVAAAMGLEMGKHVYCQKPLTWSISEARMLGKLFDEKKKEGVCTQMGNQGTSEDGMRSGVEFIRSGALGDVTEVHVWTNRPIWPQGEGRPEGKSKIPPFLSWDLFIGPAPMRPFVAGVYHPFKWRGWLDFGTGALGDMACHTANLPVMALSLFDPVSIVAESSGIVENETYPANSKITFQFPEREGADGQKLPACKLFWYDGGRKPDAELLLGMPLKDSGMLAIGSEGRLYSESDYGKDWVTLPDDKEFKKPEPSLPRAPKAENGSSPHFTEFIHACRARKPEMAMSNFDYATRLTETILWGNVALRAGEEVKVDSEGNVASPSKAAEYLGRDYRKGWTLS